MKVEAPKNEPAGHAEDEFAEDSQPAFAQPIGPGEDIASHADQRAPEETDQRDSCANGQQGEKTWVCFERGNVGLRIRDNGLQQGDRRYNLEVMHDDGQAGQRGPQNADQRMGHIRREAGQWPIASAEQVGRQVEAAENDQHGTRQDKRVVAVVELGIEDNKCQANQKGEGCQAQKGAHCQVAYDSPAPVLGRRLFLCRGLDGGKGLARLYLSRLLADLLAPNDLAFSGRDSLSGGRFRGGRRFVVACGRRLAFLRLHLLLQDQMLQLQLLLHVLAEPVQRLVQIGDPRRVGGDGLMERLGVRQGSVRDMLSHRDLFHGHQRLLVIQQRSLTTRACWGAPVQCCATVSTELHRARNSLTLSGVLPVEKYKSIVNSLNRTHPAKKRSTFWLV